MVKLTPVPNSSDYQEMDPIGDKFRDFAVDIDHGYAAKVRCWFKVMSFREKIIRLTGVYWSNKEGGAEPGDLRPHLNQEALDGFVKEIVDTFDFEDAARESYRDWKDFARNP